MQESDKTTGKVHSAYGNLVLVKFSGSISQGEVGFLQVENQTLKAEVIEIEGEIAKLQVFEETSGVKLGTEIVFEKTLLEVDLGPGLLGSVFDGLQNPLEEIANRTGLLLPRGVYLDPLDDVKHWSFTPEKSVGDAVERGYALGHVAEGRFHHKIFVPFKLYGKYTVSWIAAAGSYTIEDPIAKLHDEKGNEIVVTMRQKWPIKHQLQIGERVQAEEMLFTGLRILDTETPIRKGDTMAVPGPFGAGKTVLQHHLAKYASVDIVIIVACGERAGEVVETLQTFPHLEDVYTGEALINRTIIICNTSSMPVSAREASVYTGMTIAEYYRQMGLNVLLLADSTSRWMQAMREMSGKLEEIPAEDAFPAYLGSRIASFYERSGVIVTPEKQQGSITSIGAVSPSGGNMAEVGVQNTLKVVTAFACLSKELSDARIYPSIDPHQSWSKSRESVGKLMSKHYDRWEDFLALSSATLRQGEEIKKRIEVVGLEGTSTDDHETMLKAELYSFVYLQQNAFDKEDAFCSLERQVEAVKLLLPVLETNYKFADHDELKAFFVNLQTELKNMNYLPFGSAPYKQAVGKVKEMIAEAVAT